MSEKNSIENHLYDIEKLIKKAAPDSKVDVTLVSSNTKQAKLPDVKQKSSGGTPRFSFSLIGIVKEKEKVTGKQEESPMKKN